MELLKANKVFLDAPRADEAVEDADAPCLIVGPASTSTTEGLLANNSACAFFVVVYISGGVAEPVGRSQEGLALGCEAVWNDVGK